MKGRTTEYRMLHFWVEKQLGKPSICVHCGDTSPEKRYEWANISGEYKKDISDWRRLCVRCHRIADGQFLKPTCIRGHKLTEDNVYHPPRFPDKRECRKCRAMRRPTYKESI